MDTLSSMLKQRDNYLFNKLASKTTTVLFLMLISNVLFSCSLTSKILWGVGKPKIDEFAFQRTYLNKIGVDSSYLFMAKKFLYDSLQSGTYNVDNATKLPYISLQYRIYDNKGICLATGHSCLDKQTQKAMFAIFPPKANAFTKTNFVFSQDIEMLENAKNSIINGCDLTILVFWNTYSGTSCKEMLQMLQTYINQHKDKKICFLKGNVSLGRGKIKF